VTLGRKAALFMNGHAISGGRGDFAVAIQCAASCTISGPGVISNVTAAVLAGSLGVGRETRALVSVDGITVHDVTDGFDADEGIRASNLVIMRAVVALRAGGRIEGSNVSVTEADESAAEAAVVRFTRLSVTGGTGAGVIATRVRLVDSVVMQKIAGSPMLTSGVDVLTVKRPRLVRSTCGRSARLVRGGVPGGTWDVCAGNAQRSVN
jgi:hypothetical protein